MRAIAVAQGMFGLLASTKPNRGSFFVKMSEGAQIASSLMRAIAAWVGLASPARAPREFFLCLDGNTVGRFLLNNGFVGVVIWVIGH